jgi:hypothetical protein
VQARGRRGGAASVASSTSPTSGAVASQYVAASGPDVAPSASTWSTQRASASRPARRTRVGSSRRNASVAAGVVRSASATASASQRSAPAPSAPRAAGSEVAS